MTLPAVLFLCTANSCRSQMAEGWARVLLAGQVVAASAGTRASSVHPLAARVMLEVGVDLSSHTSKHVDTLRGQRFDLVVTVCDSAREACPVVPGATRALHRAFDDPPALAAQAKTVEEALPHFRRVRDEIRGFVLELPAILGVTPTFRPASHST